MLSEDLGEINCIHYVGIRFSKFVGLGIFSTTWTKDCKISFAFGSSFKVSPADVVGAVKAEMLVQL